MWAHLGLAEVDVRIITHDLWLVSATVYDSGNFPDILKSHQDPVANSSLY